MNVTLKQIRGFTAVVESGSFTAAAELVNSTQSSLSVLIRNLETDLGVRLLDRTTRQVRLTEAGEEFLLHAQRIIAEVEHALSSTGDLAAKRRGRVSVAAPPLIATLLLPKIIACYRAQYPDITILVEDIPPQEIVARVAAGQVDCGIGSFPGEMDGIDRAPLLEENLVMICSKDHDLARLDKVRPQDLRGVPTVGLAGTPTVRRTLDVELRLAGIHTPPAVEVRHMFTSLGMVRAGLGIALWPSWATDVLPAFDTVARPFVGASSHFTLSLITAAHRSPSPAAESFIELVKNMDSATPTECKQS